MQRRLPRSIPTRAAAGILGPHGYANAELCKRACPAARRLDRRRTLQFRITQPSGPSGVVLQ
ncbi:hypothetical protein XHV734_0892 [Xanthomonas hortorum pv. vitians]|nr:hypothetical protein XHV734_0892 [Xanthomonas hortorum pv. vitians]